MEKKLENSRIPTHVEFENLFVNNSSLIEIEAHLNRFNPIRVMKMESMEIRHSAILAWLLDPNETHGLGDKFLKSFLGEALRNHINGSFPTALDIIDADLRDTKIRLEWKNIDIFIECQTKEWAFVIENKFHSKQRKNQLSDYLDTASAALPDYKVRGVFLTLWDEPPGNFSFATINYSDVCNLVENVLKHNKAHLTNEVLVFIRHYLDVLKEANDMNEKTEHMEKLARKLYREHKKVLDFVIEHGANTDFALAAQLIFGENPDFRTPVEINNNNFHFNHLSNTQVSFLPKTWVDGFGEERVWKGCEEWWAEYPLIVWLQYHPLDDGKGGELRLHQHSVLPSISRHHES